SFAYRGIETSSNTLSKNKEIEVKVTVSNTGKRDGEEVIQLYVKHLNSKTERPVKELKAFKRIPLKAGETKTVILTLRAKDLEYWNTAKQRFELEPEDIELQAGGSSDAIALTKQITIK